MEGNEELTVGLRRTTVLPTVMHWRAEAIRQRWGMAPPARLMVATRQYYRTHLADGSHMAYIATADGEDCGYGALEFYDVLPSPDNPAGRRACVADVYVREEFSGRGLEKAITERLVEEARSHACGKISIATDLFPGCGIGSETSPSVF